MPWDRNREGSQCGGSLPQGSNAESHRLLPFGRPGRRRHHGGPRPSRSRASQTRRDPRESRSWSLQAPRSRRRQKCTSGVARRDRPANPRWCSTHRHPSPLARRPLEASLPAHDRKVRSTQGFRSVPLACSQPNGAEASPPNERQRAAAPDSDMRSDQQCFGRFLCGRSTKAPCKPGID